MLTYKQRNTFLQQLHPFSIVLIIIVYIAAFINISNPLYLTIIILSLISLSIIDGSIKELLTYGKIILPIGLLMIILNPLVVQEGNTILYQGNLNVPILGYIKITLESIIYGIFNGFRVISVTLTLGFANLIINPDRTFSFFTKYLKKTALLMSMIIRLFPRLIQRYSEISDIEKIRGNNTSSKNIYRRIEKQGNIVNILFVSSLEDAVDTAEAMYSRGYGIGRRSSYFHEKLCKWDIVFILIMFSILVNLVIFQLRGLNNMNFYPKVDNPLKNASVFGSILCSFFYIPSAINWRWNL